MASEAFALATRASNVVGKLIQVRLAGALYGVGAERIIATDCGGTEWTLVAPEGQRTWILTGTLVGM